MNQLSIGRFPELDYACGEAMNTLCTNLFYCGENIRSVLLTSRYETAFRQVIRQMSGSAAVVLIAHRLATVRMADRAAVLENGRIVEEGTICDLLAKPNGYLAGMVGVE